MVRNLRIMNIEIIPISAERVANIAVALNYATICIQQREGRIPA